MITVVSVVNIALGVEGRPRPVNGVSNDTRFLSVKVHIGRERLVLWCVMVIIGEQRGQQEAFDDVSPRPRSDDSDLERTS